MGVLVLVEEGRTVEGDAGGAIVAEVEGGGDGNVGSGVLDVLTRDAPADKRFISLSYASSGLKVDTTVGRVIVSGGPLWVVGIGGEVVPVEFRIGSGIVEFSPSVETIPPFPPAPSIIERALASEVHPIN